MRTVFRHLVKIIIIAAAVTAVTVAIVAAKGAIIGAPECPVSITYGTAITPQANAIFSGVSYEYCPVGSDEWSAEPPVVPGEYHVRAVAQSSFGNNRYSKITTFTLAPKEVNVSASEDSLIYGDTLTVSAELAEGDVLSCEFYFEDEGATATKVEPIVTDELVEKASREDHVPTYKITNSEGVDVTSSYKLNPVKKEISVVPRKLDLTVSDEEKEYNGAMLKYTEYEVSAGTPVVDGDSIFAVFDKGIIDAGEFSYEPDFVLTNAYGVDVSALYDINISVGTLTVTQRPATISTSANGQNRFEYDGKGYKFPNATTSDLLEGHELKYSEDDFPEFIYPNEDKDISDRRNRPTSISIVDSDGKDVTKNYSITFICEEIVVEKRVAVINTLGEDFVYNGRQNKNEAIDETDSTVLSFIELGFDYEIVNSTSVVDATSGVENVLELKIYDADGGDVSEYFELTYNYGILTVEPRPVLITTHNSEKGLMYDGLPHSEKGYTSEYLDTDGVDKDRDGLVPGHTLSFDYPEIVNVGNVENVFENVAVLDERGEDVSANYSLSFEYGWISIARREISISTADAERIYNALALRNSVLTVFEALDDDGTVSEYQAGLDGVTDTGDAYLVGLTLKTTGEYAVILIDGNATNVADTAEGNNTARVVYIGAEEGYDPSAAEQTAFDNYRIDYDPGTLTVTPCMISLDVTDAEKIYDGTPFESENVTFTENGNDAGAFAGTQGARIPSTGHTIFAHVDAGSEIVNVRDSAEDINEIVSVSVTDAEGAAVEYAFAGEEHKCNYELTLSAGDLTVKPRRLILEAKSAEFIYNAKVQRCREFYISELGNDGIYTVSGPYDAAVGGELSTTDASNRHLLLVDFDTESALLDVAEKSSANRILRNSVKITDSKGTVHAYTVVSDGAEPYAHTNNFEIEFKDGTLTIAPRQLLITTHDAESVYSGATLSESGYTLTELGDDGEEMTVTGAMLSTGHTVVAATTGQRTDAGSAENTITVKKISDNTGKNISFVIVGSAGYSSDHSANYEITLQLGTLTVSRRPISITTASNTWTYNGTVRSNSGYTVTSTLKFISEHRFVYSYTQKTDAGEYRNIFSDERIVNTSGSPVLTEDGKNAIENYEITYNNGTLTINKRPITIKTASATWTYDGITKNNSGYTVTSGSFVSGHTFGYSSTQATDAGEYENKFSGERIVDGEGNPVLTEDGRNAIENYAITYNCGILTINKRVVTLKTGSGSWIYDGEDHENINYSIPSGSFANGHSLDFKSTSIRLVGTAVNEFTDLRIVNSNGVEIRTENGSQNAIVNYDVRFADPGTLSVTRRNVQLIAGTATLAYNGTGRTYHSFYAIETGNFGNIQSSYTTVGGTLQLESAQDHVLSATFDEASVVTNVRDGRVVNRIVSAKVTDSSGEDVTNCFRFTYGNGDIGLEPVYLSVCADSRELTYNGQEQTYRYFYVTEYSCEHTMAVTSASALANVGLKIPFTGQSIYASFDSESKITEVEDGEVTNRITKVVISENGSNVLYERGKNYSNRNYEVHFEDGILTVKYPEIKVTASSDSVIYDGKVHASPNFNVSVGDNLITDVPIASGDEFLLIVDGLNLNITAEVSGSRTNVGTSPNKIVSVQISSNGELIAEFDYNGWNRYDHSIPNDMVAEDGEITVKPRPITVISEGDEKIFDNTPLTNGNYTVIDGDSQQRFTGDGTLNSTGEHISVIMSGSQVDLGASPNYIEAIEIDSEYNNENYDITYKEGTLVVVEGDLSLGLPESFQSDMYEIMYEICADTDGKLYLKKMSYGDYSGQGWKLAQSYDNFFGSGYSPVYLPGVLAGVDRCEVMITPYNGAPFVLPYYLSIGDDNGAQMSDVIFTSNASGSYSALYYKKLSAESKGHYSEYEAAYRDFVYANYLSIDEESLEYMKTLIANQGFDINDPDVIEKVAAYMQLFAGLTYNMEYDRALDGEENVAVAFLDEYKEGICQHYATAATLIYRALGIPARYTVGYSVNAFADNNTYVYSGNGHAWVEVYVDGIGWRYVEVTGADNSSGLGSTGNGSGSSDGEKLEINVRPADRICGYDGNYHTATTLEGSGYAFEFLKENGYTFEVDFGGGAYSGKTTTWINSLIIYDQHGSEVYNSQSGWGDSIFDVNFENGYLEIRESLYVRLGSLGKSYDGKELSIGTYHKLYGEYGEIFVTYDIDISMTDAGVLTVFDLNMNSQDYITYLMVTDVYGNDLTDNFAVMFCDKYGNTQSSQKVLEITPIEINITAGSGEWSRDDADEITVASYTVSGSEMPAGYTLEVETEGTLTKGDDFCINVVSYWCVKNAKGEVVASSDEYSDNFVVNCYEGWLQWID